MTAAHRRQRDGRGAVAVEAALVTPLLFLFLIGIIEMSLLMRDVIASTSSARTGARVASVSAAAGPGGCAGGADAPTCVPSSVPALAQAAADAIERGSSSMPKDSIEAIYVYRANDLGFPFPSSNQDVASCTTDCVIFEWVPSIERFRYVRGTWDSRLINACVNETDAVGVAIDARHTWITGVFGDSITLTERSVFEFEPLPNDSCKPGTPRAHP